MRNLPFSKLAEAHFGAKNSGKSRYNPDNTAYLELGLRCHKFTMLLGVEWTKFEQKVGQGISNKVQI